MGVDGRPDHLWYVAYGADLCQRRLQSRLGHGPDPTPPRANRPLVIAHDLWFSGDQADIDPEPRHGVRTLARGWLVRFPQAADLLRQDSGTLIRLGARAGYPMVTVTRSTGLDPARLSSPTAQELAVMAQGLKEAHGLGPVEAASYLIRRPGVAGAWRASDLLLALGGRSVA
jgi:hypothetical protein